MRRKINVAQWLMDAFISSRPSWICRDENDKFPLECGSRPVALNARIGIRS